MLYLEDYLEMIEHLPQELRDRFTEMREMDLSVQNNMDTLEKRVRTLFSGCRRNEIQPEQGNTEFSDIKRGYNKTLEEADEKVSLANQMYELVDRYLRKLDTELHKFKCELEADNKGITEVLEKRSLELDTNSTHNHNHGHSHSSSNNNSHYKESRYRIRAEKRRDSWANPRDRLHAAAARNDPLMQATLGVTRELLDGDLTVAASHAITATHHMSLGRRTTPMKASYEAVSGADASAMQAAQHALHDHGHGPAPGHSSGLHHAHSSSSANKRHGQKKKSSYSAPAPAPAPAPAHHTARALEPALGLSTVVGTIEEPMEEEWSCDPNEPRYCTCNQVSYGDMVACDNHECPYEWFHYPCVGITAPPKGKWYCAQCQANMRRNRAHRKN